MNKTKEHFMSGGEGGSWSGQDMKLGNGLCQFVSRRPLVAFKTLALLKIIELGGSPQVKITFNDETVIEGYFDGVIVESGSFKLDIHIFNKENIKIDQLLIKEIFVIDQDSEHITEQSIERSLEFDLEIDRYFQAKNIGAGGVN
jgi:hypothetical protein